jgi:hypothetical protein
MLKRAAFLTLFFASAVNACIFDSGGDYNGGGRRDIGAKLNQGDTPPPEEEAGTGSSSGSTGQDSGPRPPTDGAGQIVD